MDIPGFCNEPKNMVKRVIHRDKGSKYYSFALQSYRGQSEFLELFLLLQSARVPGMQAGRDK